MRTHPASRLSVPVSERDHIKGPASALVTLVEYGDYECPYCGAAYPVVEEILRAMGKRLRFVFRHFPLSQMHPHAQDAAEAAEAAAAQDKFWDMHGMLYTHQEALDESDLLTYAVALGLDPKPVRKALEEDAYLDRVREDFISGARSGVNGTPSFFIEGVRYDGPHDFDSFLAVLVEAADNKAR